MKRIIKSFLILIIIIAFTSSAAFAFFTSQAKIESITFSTGNANLQISHLENNWTKNITPGVNFLNITPNWSENYEIFVKNTGTTNLNLILKGELQSGWEDQANLRKTVKIRVLEFNDANEKIHDFGEKNLDEIQNDSGNEFELEEIDANENRAFLLQFSVPNELDEKYQNQSLTGFNFVFYGENNY